MFSCRSSRFNGAPTLGVAASPILANQIGPDVMHLLAYILACATVALNLPFGAYRGTTRRFSWRWFLAIHLPIPFIFLMRRAAGYGYSFIPVLLAAAVAGQILGARLALIRRRYHSERRDAVAAPEAAACASVELAVAKTQRVPD
jgi:hypothetical protein